MTIVIPYIFTKDEYDFYHRVIHNKGDKIVSHGIDIDTLETEVLPQDDFDRFVRANCYYNTDLCEHVLKES